MRTFRFRLSGRGSGALALGLSVLSAGGLGISAAHAQFALPQSEHGDADEIPLPDIGAIERGAKARASVSFGAPTPSTPDQNAQNGQAGRSGPGENPENVRRLQPATPTPNPGGSAGIYGLQPSFPGILPERIRPARIPEQHVVRQGDTLSSVSDHYFGDALAWPKLWAQNPQITNPHWIFPGDEVRLQNVAQQKRPGTGGGPGMRLSSSGSKSFDMKSVVLRETGFIDQDALQGSGEISGSREEKIMLASGDQAYVAFRKDRPLRAGETYSVFVADRKNPVRDPDSGAILGYLVRVYGHIEIDQIAEGNIARGTLISLVGPIERGYSVSHKVRLFKQVEPTPSDVTVEAKVVASFSPSILLAAESFVVLSRGAKDGLEVGNRSFVVRQGDGYRRVLESWDVQDERYPKEVVAELWVMDVTDRAAVAWVARSTKELRLGEVAELRKGH